LFRKPVSTFRDHALTALFGGPAAGATARRAGAAPGAGPVAAGESAGSAGALAALGDRHMDGAVAADLAADVEIGLARIGDPAVADAHRVTIGAVARPAVGHDQNAPRSVVGSLRGSWHRGHQQRRRHGARSDEGTIRKSYWHPDHLVLGI